MKLRLYLFFLMGLLLAAPAFSGTDRSVEVRKTEHLVPQQLGCEYRTDPLGIEESHPRLNWSLAAAGRSQKQTAYQILVAGSAESLKRDKGDLWDSGKVDSDETAQIAYAGKALASRMECWWKVRVWDEGGHPSEWSPVARWTMGLTGKGEWTAEWVGFGKAFQSEPGELTLEDADWIWSSEADKTDINKLSTAQGFFRKTFRVPPSPPIKEARMIVTADDLYKLYLDGKLIAQSDERPNAWMRLRTLDLTPLLRAGKHVFAVEAYNKGLSPAGLIGKLEIMAANGKPFMTIVTDKTWRYAAKAEKNWTAAGLNDKIWEDATVVGPFGCGPWSHITGRKPARYLRHEFSLARPIRKATVYVTALGIYQLSINGQRVGKDYFTPGWTDYSKRVYYSTYDVTGLLKEGDNAIGAILAGGWYAGRGALDIICQRYGDTPALRAQLYVDYTDGTTEIFATDKSWKAAQGPIRAADFFMGETYDACQAMAGWDKTGFRAAGWRPVEALTVKGVQVQAYPHEAVRQIAEVTPIGITEPQKEKYVFNFGQNFTGFARLKVKGPKGCKVTLRFAERLNPDGTIYTTNLRDAASTDVYICRGEGEETWAPQFTYHGFQYVELSGYPGKPGKEALTGLALSSDTPVVGSFECSDKMVNQLYSNICRTQRSNFMDIPTDCPQRDERFGWMGDAQIYIRTASFITDVAAFFTKWTVDVDDAQFPDGSFSNVSPTFNFIGSGVAAWGDAGVICPWTVYQVYGDKRILERHYAAMARWIEYCKKNSKNLVRPDDGFGDWVSIQADTPKDVLGTAYFAYSTDLMSRIAEVLGKQEDAARYHKLFGQITEAFNKAFVAKDGRIKGDTQTVYVLALAYNLLPKEKRPLATRFLVDNIQAKGWRLSTGFIGTKDLMTVLSQIGRTDVAYRLLHSEAFPSWGFSIKHGATSIWEHWDGWTPEKGFCDPTMNSFAHYSFGAVGEWMFETVGGIDMDRAGYKHLIIRPQPGGKISSARASYQSIRGPVATDWKLKGKQFDLNVTIPPNTTARVFILAKRAEDITESGKPIARCKDAKFIKLDKGAAVFEVGSGSYAFHSASAE